MGPGNTAAAGQHRGNRVELALKRTIRRLTAQINALEAAGEPTVDLDRVLVRALRALSAFKPKSKPAKPLAESVSDYFAESEDR